MQQVPETWCVYMDNYICLHAHAQVHMHAHTDTHTISIALTVLETENSCIICWQLKWVGGGGRHM
jgi:hypothetical protein